MPASQRARASSASAARRVRKQLPEARIVVALWAGEGDTGRATTRLEQVGVDQVVTRLPEAIEAGWVTARHRWGEGLAGEAVRAAHAWFDATHGRQRTTCMIVPGNTASERIAAGLGYRAFLTARHKGDEVRLYERV